MDATTARRSGTCSPARFAPFSSSPAEIVSLLNQTHSRARASPEFFEARQGQERRSPARTRRAQATPARSQAISRDDAWDWARSTPAVWPMSWKPASSSSRCLDTAPTARRPRRPDVQIPRQLACPADQPRGFSGSSPGAHCRLAPCPRCDSIPARFSREARFPPPPARRPERRALRISVLQPSTPEGSSSTTVIDDRANGNNPAGRKSRQAESAGDYTAMRTPPHDLTAEQAVLGSTMLSKDASPT